MLISGNSLTDFDLKKRNFSELWIKTAAHLQIVVFVTAIFCLLSFRFYFFYGFSKRTVALYSKSALQTQFGHIAKSAWNI